VRKLYNILTIAATAVKTPLDWLRFRRRGNWRPLFRQRYGQYDSKFKQSLTNRDAIWIHAESVEEINLCTQIIRVLEPRIPNVKIVASARTSAGIGELTRKLPSQIGKVYFPLDRRSAVGRALITIRPMAIILVEAAIRPNYLWRAAELKMPVFLVNSRIPEASRRRYQRFGFLFRPLFASLAGVCARDAADATRLRALGCRSETILLTGELPHEAARLQERRVLDVPTMLRQMGVAPDARLLVAGGTCDGEEAMLVERFQNLRARFPDLFLVLAPRRFERCRELGGLLRSRQIKFVYRNEITPATQLAPDTVECLMLNTSGELRFFCDRASLTVVGSSLSGDGAQDPIELGMAAKPMVFGPKTGPFAPLVQAFTQHGGAVQVHSPDELEQTLAELLTDEPRRQQMGRNTIGVVRQNLAAIDRTVELIIKHLADQELYFAPGLRK